MSNEEEVHGQFIGHGHTAYQNIVYNIPLLPRKTSLSLIVEFFPWESSVFGCPLERRSPTGHLFGAVGNWMEAFMTTEHDWERSYGPH